MSVRDKFDWLKFGAVNYVRSPTRETPINLAVARFLLGSFLVWEVVEINAHSLLEPPYVGSTAYDFLLQVPPSVLVIEKYLLILSLLAVILGYRLKLAAAASVVLLSHFAGIRFVYNISHSSTTLFIAMYFLLFFGIYATRDELTVDSARTAGGDGSELDSLVSRLKSDSKGTYRMDALRWSLLVFSLIYFGSGFYKLLIAPGQWFAADNLSRILTIRNTLDLQWHPVGKLLVEQQPLVFAASVGTIILECGFLVAVLANVGVTLFVLGLIGFHVGIWLSIGIIFDGAILYLLVFLSWDELYRTIVRSRELDLVFDERCLFCARSLLPFKLLDVDDTVTFYSQSDAPEAYSERAGVDFERAMYVFDDGTAYEGYYAFRELIRQFTVFAPLVWFMGLPVIESIGNRVYRHIADNRSRHFTCSVDIEAGSDS